MYQLEVRNDVMGELYKQKPKVLKVWKNKPKFRELKKTLNEEFEFEENYCNRIANILTIGVEFKDHLFTLNLRKVKFN